MLFSPTTVLQTIDKIVNYFQFYKRAEDAFQTKSLTEVTKLTRVEPLTVVSKDCITLEYMPDIMQTLLNIFAGYYLQAVAIGARVDSVKVIKILDRLNPDRDGSGNVLMPTFESMRDLVNISAESYEFRLPTSLNTRALQSEMHRLENKISLEDSVTGTVDKDSYTKAMSEVTNLAVGKFINVTICSPEKSLDPNASPDDSKFTIPVNVRLSATTMPNHAIAHLLTLKTDDESLSERFHKWRSGRITFISDLILCQDLIDEHRKALMNDESGVYSEITRRVNNAKKYGLLSKNPSLVSASNLFVISEVVERELELKFGGKLSNARIRDKAFENTYAMIICVIDRERERVTFYHRGIAQATEVSIRDIKAASKSKSGPDVMDILRAYQTGSAPSF